MTEQTKAEAGAKLADDLRSWLNDTRSVSSIARMLADYDAATKPRTITVNGVEVPEPVREAPVDGTMVCYVDINDARMAFASSFFANSHYDQRALRRGLIHLTREAAESHARALIGATAQEKQA